MKNAMKYDMKADFISWKIFQNAEANYRLARRFLNVFDGHLTYYTQTLAKEYVEWQARLILHFANLLPKKKEMEKLLNDYPDYDIDEHIMHVNSYSGKLD
jgi:hypothetical protein